MSSRLLLAFALAAGLGLAGPTGCSRTGAQVQTGVDLYERGAYEGALVRFQQVGADEGDLRAKHRVRYLVYRGLAHWHLGQIDEARTYLAEAQAALAEEDANPKWIPADVRAELAHALAQLGLGGRPSTGVPLPGATTAPTQAPPPPVPGPRGPPGPPGPAAPPPGPGAQPPPAPAPTVGPAPAPVPPGPPAAPPAPPPPPGPPGPGGPPPSPIPPAASPPPADPL